VGVATVTALMFSNRDPLFGINAGFVALCLISTRSSRPFHAGFSLALESSRMLAHRRSLFMHFLATRSCST
jgi:hypothetical protein